MPGMPGHLVARSYPFSRPQAGVGASDALDRRSFLRGREKSRAGPIQVRSHPRAIRTVEFADHCDAVSSLKLPEPYPPFVDWRRKVGLSVASPG